MHATNFNAIEQWLNNCWFIQFPLPLFQRQFCTAWFL